MVLKKVYGERRKQLPKSEVWVEDRSLREIAYDYLAAVDVLCENIFRYPAYADDAHIFFRPVMYMYRHSIECLLKYFLQSPFINKPNSSSHSLTDLYKNALPFFQTYLTKSEIKPLSKIINFYSKYDTEKGELFKYSTGKKNESLIGKQLRFLNFKETYKNIRSVKSIFTNLAYRIGGDEYAEQFLFFNQVEDLEIKEEFAKKAGKIARSPRLWRRVTKR